jgi:hypothetical protein
MYPVFVPLALVTVTAIPSIAQDASARTVQYHSQDIVPIHAKLKYTTATTSGKANEFSRSSPGIAHVLSR